MKGTGSQPVSNVAPAEERPRKRKIGRLVLAAVLALVIVGGGGLAWYMFTGQQDPAESLPPKADYLALSPAFVVNLEESSGGPRYLQVEVQLVTRDPAATAQLQHHAPALRARLLMLFAQQTREALSSREGKEALQARALEEVRALMVAETGQPQADALLFTSFVTQ
ncbi:flagellar basal body-associated FliL family protein [Luteimonas granuli]|uniref:Flagellar protein FliL n=1 Tax=Luteimonas granuli TaxID=1176533 RepID=A0A518N0V3_9GAMM|nr:flagellar basal body-associated FliL family protein [Luteimonas granuli]